jgi:hypothetical protein
VVIFTVERWSEFQQLGGRIAQTRTDERIRKITSTRFCDAREFLKTHKAVLVADDLTFQEISL